MSKSSNREDDIRAVVQIIHICSFRSRVRDEIIVLDLLGSPKSLEASKGPNI